MSGSTETRILGAALELVAERGLAGVTMSAIATAAGVSRQTLYNHFPDVDSAVYAAAAAHQQLSLQELRKMLDTIASPAGRLEHLVRHTAALAAGGHPSVGSSGFSPDVRDLMAGHDREVQSLVAAALTAGRDSQQFRRDLDVDVDSLLILRLIEACGELVASNPDDTSALVKRTVRTVLAAVENRA